MVNLCCFRPDLPTLILVRRVFPNFEPLEKCLYLFGLIFSLIDNLNSKSSLCWISFGSEFQSFIVLLKKDFSNELLLYLCGIYPPFDLVGQVFSKSSFGIQDFMRGRVSCKWILWNKQRLKRSPFSAIFFLSKFDIKFFFVSIMESTSYNLASSILYIFKPCQVCNFQVFVIYW